MTDQPSQLDPQHHALAIALAAGMTHDAAGEVIGVSGRTVRRRLANEPALCEAVEAERQSIARRVADALTDRATSAVDRLSRIVSEGTDRDAAAAAAVLLRETRQHREAAYIAERLRAVEDALHTRKDTA